MQHLRCDLYVSKNKQSYALFIYLACLVPLKLKTFIFLSLMYGSSERFWQYHANLIFFFFFWSFLTHNIKLLAVLNYTKKLKPDKANGMLTLFLDLLNFQHFLGPTASNKKSQYLLTWNKVSILGILVQISVEQS